ncbi:MAG: hypothetical protein ABUL62_10890 [Myxococcales bacterium]
MTEDARNHFQAIAELYASLGFPERESWLVQAGDVSNVHHELEAEGLIERVFGTKRGFAWRLTQAGVERAKSGYPR